MKKIIFVAILMTLIIGCKKDEEIIPTPSKPLKCHCIQDTCYVTFDQIVRNDLPADSCKVLIIQEVQDMIEGLSMDGVGI